MPLKIAQLSKDIGNALWESLKGDFPDIRDYALGEARKFAQSFKTIDKLYKEGKINQEQAKLHVDIQKTAARMVFLTISGLGLLTFERAINAAFDVIRSLINSTLGFILI